MLKDPKQSGEGLKELRSFLGQFHTSNYYDANRRETLEMQLLASELLLSTELQAADAKTVQEDVNYLMRLLDAYKNKTQDRIKPFLRRYYELAIRAVGKDQPTQMAERLLELRASSLDRPTVQTTRVVFHFAANDEEDPNEDYAIVCALGSSAKLVPLNLTRKMVQQAPI